ncbi:MAG: SOS response-associated peptidase, partial [Cellulosimicrobium funkei]
MCGRYASFRDAQDLADEFAIADVADDARLLPPSWNLAPTDP